MTTESASIGLQPSAPVVHRRVHTSLTAALEKRVLVALARRLPAWVNSDQLTVLGFVAMIGVAAAFAAAAWWPAAPLMVPVLLGVNWFGDSLDGTLARVRDCQRPRYGFYVDHVVDVIGIAALGAGLACSSLVHPMLALAVALGYLLLAAESFLATHALATFRMSFGPFGPTELRLVLALGAIKAASSPHVYLWPVGEVRLFDAGAVVAIAGMLGAFVVTAARNTRALWLAETGGAG